MRELDSVTAIDLDHSYSDGLGGRSRALSGDGNALAVASDGLGVV